MRETRIPIVVQVGEAQITVQDLLKLKSGDVVRLNTSPSQEIDVLIENLVKLKGRPGVSSKKKALQVTQVCSPQESA
jgi:flagellar motor switch protein FliM